MFALDGIEKEGQSALMFSLAISGASLLFHLITTIYEMRKEGLNCCGYFNSLIQMGVGLPLRAIVSNTIGKELKIEYDLLDGQVRSLGVALRSNTSLETIRMRNQNDGNGLAMVLGDVLKTNNTLKLLSIADSNFTDDSGLQSIINLLNFFTKAY